MLNKIQELIYQDKFEDAMAYCSQCVRGDDNSNELMICYLLLYIHMQEIEKAEFYLFDFSKELDILIQHYHRIKFLVRRVEFEWIEAERMELVRYCMDNQVSASALISIIQFSTRNPQLVLQKVRDLFQDYQDSFL